jgi:hypothetical protein
LQPPAEPIENARNGTATAIPQPVAPPLPENKIHWRAAVSSALVAGMLAAVGTWTGVVPLAMLCMFAAGGLAVTLYRRRAGYHAVTSWMGIRVGVLAGGWGFGLLAFLSTLQLFSSARLAELHSFFDEKMREMIATNADPGAQIYLSQLRVYLASDRGLIVVSLVGMAVLGLFFLLFSALGGALGAALFGRESGRKES